MFAFLKSLFTGKKPPVKEPPTSGYTYIAADTQKLTAIDPETLPLWYRENPTLEGLTFMASPEDLTPPAIRPEIRLQLMSYVKEVSPEPSSALHIYQSLNNDDSTMKEIAGLISSEPMLTAEILRLVNSAYYGLRDEVTSVGKAVTLLGTANIKAVVLNLSLRSAFGTTTPEEQRIKEHSATVAAISRTLATKVCGVDIFEAETLGLLHDMGKILYPLVKEAGKDIVMNIEVPQPVLESLLASTFASLWGLPKSISTAVEYVHYPCFYPKKSIPDEYRGIATVVSAANLLGKSYGFDDGDPLSMLRSEQSELLGFSGHPNSWLTHSDIEKIEAGRTVMA